MAEVTDLFNNLIPTEYNLLFTLLFFTAIIILYSVFVFYFYRFLAKKNIIELNLNQYNQYQNTGVVKTFAAIFYILEYIIVLPIITFFWFGVLAILILLLAEGIGVSTILLISAALVASVRFTAYVSESLSTDLAKMIPFTLIAIAITKPGFFNAGALVSRFLDIPSLFVNLPYYLLFIISVELIMRAGEFITGIFGTGEEVFE